jgi:hypothetical protein
MTKRKTKKVTARVVGPILYSGHDVVLWKLRLKAPNFPFYIDSATCFTTKEQADKEAEKWQGRKVVISISQ